MFGVGRRREGAGGFPTSPKGRHHEGEEMPPQGGGKELTELRVPGPPEELEQSREGRRKGSLGAPA